MTDYCEMTETIYEDRRRLLEHMQALEHTRADLWGQNEELRLKCVALERGQEDLLAHFDSVLRDVAARGRAYFETVNVILEELRLKPLPDLGGMFYKDEKQLKLL